MTVGLVWHVTRRSGAVYTHSKHKLNDLHGGLNYCQTLRIFLSYHNPFLVRVLRKQAG